MVTVSRVAFTFTVLNVGWRFHMFLFSLRFLVQLGTLFYTRNVMCGLDFVDVLVEPLDTSVLEFTLQQEHYVTKQINQLSLM